MSSDSENALIEKTVRWYEKSSHEISVAGGFYQPIINSFPPDLLRTLVRNDLVLKYDPK